MNRYNDVGIDKTHNFRRIKTTIYPKIDIGSNDLYIYSVEGDTLWNLAYKYYSDVNLWWIIAQANRIGKNSQAIESGLQLRIPQDIDLILTNLQKINGGR